MKTSSPASRLNRERSCCPSSDGEETELCEVSAYLESGGLERLLMRDVVALEPDGDLILLRSLLGEQKLLRARLKGMDFLRNRITLEEIRPAPAIL